MEDAEDRPQDQLLGQDPKTHLDVVLREGPYGPYVQLGDKEEGSKTRPPRSSLPKGRDPSSVDLDYALRLLSLPRILGTDPDTGSEVTAGLGRYGPYVERSRTYRSLKDPDQLFTVTLHEALELLATKSGPAVLKELGPHPVSEVPLRVLDGRYGPYVTDGSINASLPKEADPGALTLEEGVQLITARAKLGKKGAKKGRKVRGGGRTKGSESGKGG